MINDFSDNYQGQQITLEEPSPEIKGLWIPIEILNSKLSHTAQKVYALLCMYSSKKCWLSNRAIGEIVTAHGESISEETISGIIKELIEAGLIETSIRFNPYIKKTERIISVKNKSSLKKEFQDSRLKENLKTGLKENLKSPVLRKTLSKEYNNNVSNYMRKEINININKRDFSNLKGIKDRYIEKWNELEGTQKHKNPNTAVYKKAKKLIQQLKDGSIWKYNKLSDEFIEKHKITPELLQKKWTPKEILINIENLSKLFINGYWPKDKSKLPKALPDLIFNSNSGCSQFLLCHIHPPQLLSEQRASKFIDKFPLLSPEVHEFFEIKSYSEKIKMQQYIQEWMDSHEKRFPQERPYVASKFRTGYYAIREYIEWLKDEMAWLGGKKKNISLMKIGCDRYNKWYKSEKENWTEDEYDSGWNTNDYEGEENETDFDN